MKKYLFAITLACAGLYAYADCETPYFQSVKEAYRLTEASEISSLMVTPGTDKAFNVGQDQIPIVTGRVCVLLPPPPDIVDPVLLHNGNFQGHIWLQVKVFSSDGSSKFAYLQRNEDCLGPYALGTRCERAAH